ACAISAVAPNLLVFTSAQVLQRGLLITTATVAGIAVIEQSPERARAYSASMLALAGGFGFSLAVVVLPLADLGNWGWRLPFALGAGTIFLAPSISRHLAETTRYTTLTTHAEVVRGRLRDRARALRRDADGLLSHGRSRDLADVCGLGAHRRRGWHRVGHARRRAVPDGGARHVECVAHDRRRHRLRNRLRHRRGSRRSA